MYSHTYAHLLRFIIPKQTYKKENLHSFSKQFIYTSALYILNSPLFTLLHKRTPLIFHSWLECSANGPVFTWNNMASNKGNAVK